MTEKNTKAGNRRRFLKGGAAAAAGAATIGFPMVSRAQTMTLKMQGAWGAKDIFNDMAMEYVDRVNKMSGGRLKIDYLVAGAVVKSFQVMDAVHQGVLDAGHQVPAYWYGKHKAASLFGTGPVFGADAHQMLAWVSKGGGRALYNELLQDILKLNVVGFFCMPMPPQPLGWFKKEIKSADDLKGLKYRTVGLAADLMQEMGVNVTQLPGGEIVPALEKGVIEAFEYNNPTSDMRFGAQDVSKIYIMGSYHQAIEYFEIVFNKRKFDQLPDELKSILEYSAEAANTSNYALGMDNYSSDLQKLINEHGVKVYKCPDSVYQAQLAAWDKLVEQLGADPYFKKVVDSQKAWVERVGFYSHMASNPDRMAYDHQWPGRLPSA